MTAPTDTRRAALLEVQSCLMAGGRTHVDGTSWPLPGGLMLAALWSIEDRHWQVLLMDAGEQRVTVLSVSGSRQLAHYDAHWRWVRMLHAAADTIVGAP